MAARNVFPKGRRPRCPQPEDLWCRPDSLGPRSFQPASTSRFGEACRLPRHDRVFSDFPAGSNRCFWKCENSGNLVSVNAHFIIMNTGLRQQASCPMLHFAWMCCASRIQSHHQLQDDRRKVGGVSERPLPPRSHNQEVSHHICKGKAEKTVCPTLSTVSSRNKCPAGGWWE